MRKLTERCRNPLSGLVCALALVALGVVLAPPARSQAPTGHVGYVNTFLVQTNARVYQAGFDSIAEGEAEIQDRKVIESAWRFLVGERARRAVELELKGTDRTEEETEELLRLRQENGDLDLEWYRLSNRNYLDDEDLARLRELQQILDTRSRETQGIYEGLNSELAALQQETYAGFNACLATALHATAQKHGLEVILASHIPALQPASAEGNLDVYWENVVLYGGVDVTDDVIATMNDQGPPPAPRGGAVNEDSS